MVSFTDTILSKIIEFEKKFKDLNSIFNIPEFSQKPEDEAERLTKVELFIQEADASVIDIIKFLSYSLLSGEYILLPNLKETLSSIEFKVKDFINNTDFLPNNIQEKIFEYSSSISIVIEGYKIFVRDIANKYSEERVEFVFSQNNQFEKSIKESNLSDKIDGVTDYFFLLLAISQIDHFPSNENEYISILFDIEKKIKNLKIQEFNEISKNVLTKIKFLKHKWKARKVSENPTSHLYLDDGDIKSVEDFNEENPKLREWTEIIETQYELISKNWIYILESRIKPYKNKPFEELKILELHQLIKYYKDVKPDHTKLKQISKYLSEKIKPK